MLVLSRKKNESIIIDGKIEIKIIEAEDGRVRIGIEAPKSIEIHRKEIFDLIAKENEEATHAKSNLSQLKGKSFKVNEKYDSKKNENKPKLL